VAYTILFRRGTASQWTQANPVLNLGELGFVTDSKKLKIGNGITPWNSLDYSIATLENGKIPLDQLPDTVKIAVHEVGTIAQRNNLTVQPGDMAVVSEEVRTYVSNGSGGSASWVEIATTPDFTGYATESFVDDSINNLNISSFVTGASANFIVDSAIQNANLGQYATTSYVNSTISSLEIPDSSLFEFDYQDDSVIIGHTIPQITGSASANFLYLGTTGLGENVFTSSSAILSTYPSASAVHYSTAIGAGSMSASYLNYENTAIGYATLLKGGFENVAVGANALHSIAPDPADSILSPATSTSNTAVGYSSLFSVTTGKKNTAIGHNSMINAATGHSNIAIGSDSLRYDHEGSPFDGQNAIAIGASATVPGSSTIKIGNANHVMVIDNSIFKYSDSRDMSSATDSSYGLSFINELRPVEFVSDPRNGGVARNSLGFVASEVISASPSFTGYVDFNSEGTSDIKALAYDQFIPPIVKSIQEIDTRLIVTESDVSQIATLSASVAALTASVAVLLDGEATYETYSFSSVSTEYFSSASAGSANPTVTLVKGRKYRFDLSGVLTGQPFALRESSGVTNNVVGTTGNNPTSGISGSSSSNYIFYSVPSVPAYSSLIYQSVNSAGMMGVINLVDP
jgi:hypothetical protein